MNWHESFNKKLNMYEYTNEINNYEKELKRNYEDKIIDLVKEYSEINFKTKDFDANIDSIPVSGKVIGSRELELMTESVLDGWLTTGRFNDEFEKKLSNWLNVEYLLTVNSGSSANLVAFNTLTSSDLGDRAIKKGDEVICVAGGFQPLLIL